MYSSAVYRGTESAYNFVLGMLKNINSVLSFDNDMRKAYFDTKFI